MKDIQEIIKDHSKHEPGTHTHYVKSVEELYELLTPKRLELLISVLKYADNPKNINEVSRKTKRKQESVSRDVALLTKHNLIEKIRKGRNAFLKANYDTIEIKLAE